MRECGDCVSFVFCIYQQSVFKIEFSYNKHTSSEDITLQRAPEKTGVLDDVSSDVAVQGGFETHIPKHLEFSTM